MSNKSISFMVSLWFPTFPTMLVEILLYVNAALQFFSPSGSLGQISVQSFMLIPQSTPSCSPPQPHSRAAFRGGCWTSLGICEWEKKLLRFRRYEQMLCLRVFHISFLLLNRIVTALTIKTSPLWHRCGVEPLTEMMKRKCRPTK